MNETTPFAVYRDLYSGCDAIDSWLNLLVIGTVKLETSGQGDIVASPSPLSRWARLFGTVERGAFTSPTNDRRYLLWKRLGGNLPPLVFCMLNPSVASAMVDDPTWRRCVSYAERELASGVVLVNLSPWRATNPKDMDLAIKNGAPVLDPWINGRALAAARSLAPFVVAWGGKYRPWMAKPRDEVRLLHPLLGSEVSAPARCLGYTVEGHPVHPLMQPKVAPLQVYDWTRAP